MEDLLEKLEQDLSEAYEERSFAENSLEEALAQERIDYIQELQNFIKYHNEE